MSFLLSAIFCLSSVASAHLERGQNVWSGEYDVHSCRSDLFQTGTIDLGHTVKPDSCWKLSITLNLATISFGNPPTDTSSGKPLAGRYDKNDPMPEGDNLSAYNKWGASLIEANGKTNEGDPAILGNDYGDGFQIYMFSTGNYYQDDKAPVKEDYILAFKYGKESFEEDVFYPILSRADKELAEEHAVKDANGNITKTLTISIEYHAATDGEKAYFTLSDLSYAGMAFDTTLEKYYLHDDTILELSTLNYAVTLLEDTKMNVVKFTQTTGEEIVPEPATATLGLMALTLVCASKRRRTK